MIFICWNCRGIRAVRTKTELKDQIYKYKPHLLFLSETKATRSKLQNLKRRFNFDEMHVVDCTGKSGGLGLLWKKNINVEIIFSDCNVIHTYISNMNANINFHYSFVYGNPTSQHMKHFWEKLKNLHPHNDKPWACAGDFNELLDQSDKNGAKKHCWKQI